MDAPVLTLPVPARPDTAPRHRHVAALTVLLLLALAAAGGEATPPAPPPLLAPLSSGEMVPLPALDPAVPSPAAFLGHPLGERFSRYAEQRAYLAALAAASDRVRTWDYGSTYLGRPLTLVAISSPANLARLDEIRDQRQRLADPAVLSAGERRALVEDEPAVVWLAYGVHGNESSSAEAALGVTYLLAAADDDAWERRLDDLVILVDPLSNPDGRERYVAGFQQRRGRRPDPDPQAREHDEAWPGGRGNHYLVDLNRDWSWATQRETRYRLQAFRTWQPQVYVDLHEMYYDATYFFPPSADPVNREIDRRVVAWLDVFGRSNAAAFDRLGWLYYKGETFDLFYPGYADSYASFRGAVGMTYEVGGGGRAGLAVHRDDGTLLTLADRLARHVVASLATVEAAAAHRQRLMADFVDGRMDNTRRRDAPTYLWPADRPEATALARLLARHGIAVYRLDGSEELPARALPPTGPRNASAAPHSFPAGTWAVPGAQPLGNLVRALLEPDIPMSEEFVNEQRRRVEQDLDAAFYDVTAWSLPLAFNVEAWAAERTPRHLGTPLPPPPPPSADDDAPASENGEAAVPAVAGHGVGWLVPPAGLATYRLAARLQEAGVAYRLALADFAVGGHRYSAGTLFVPRLGAPPGTDALLGRLAATAGVTVNAAPTSYGEGGLSLGSDRVVPVAPARIALAAGDGVAPSSLGSLWHLLDRQTEVPHTLVELGDLPRTDLAAFDVLVLPDGWGYAGALDGDAGDALEAWLRGGGVLVAVGGAIDWLRQRDLTAVEEWKPQEGGDGDPESPDAVPGSGSLDRPLYVPGAVVATEMRAGHPLTAGLTAAPPTMVAGTRPLLATGEPQTDVLTVARDEPILAGFAWPESKQRLAGSLLVSSETVGRGRLVLFAQEPGFRLFWRGTMPLFLNAVMFGPSLPADGGY